MPRNYLKAERPPTALHAMDQGIVNALHAQGKALYRAAQVIMLTPQINKWLADNDPMALRQVQHAVEIEKRADLR